MSRFSSNASGCAGVFGILGGGIIAYISVFLVIGLIFGAPVEYVAEYWFSYLKEESVDLPYWACILAAAFPPIGFGIGGLGGVLTLLSSFAIENPYYIPN